MRSVAGVHDVEGNEEEGRWVHAHTMACYHMEGVIEADFCACAAPLSPSFGGQVEEEGEVDCGTCVFQEAEGPYGTQNNQLEGVSLQEGSHHCNPWSCVRQDVGEGGGPFWHVEETVEEHGQPGGLLHTTERRGDTYGERGPLRTPLV
jgi:hypothetical protein